MIETDITNMGKFWYAIYSQPNKEDSLWKQLQRRSVEVFYPRIRVTPVNPRSRKVRPYFPRYLFIRVDLEETGVSTLQYIPFSVGLVSFGGEPAVVPENLIQSVREKVKEIEEAGGETFVDLKKGDQVFVENGPFVGYEAIFDLRLPDSDRVQVFLKMLSDRQLRVEMDASQIKKKKQD